MYDLRPTTRAASAGPTIEVDVPLVDRDGVNGVPDDREPVISGELKERRRTGVLRPSSRRTGQFEYRAALPTRPTPKESTRSRARAC
jgi:HSP20 family protein